MLVDKSFLPRFVWLTESTVLIEHRQHDHSNPCHLGRIDNETGQLKITGRIKEIIITAGGENIAPINIEDAFKDSCQILSNVMVIGENRKFLSAILTIKSEIDMETNIPSN